jgi:segregation and condensation protein B
MVNELEASIEAVLLTSTTAVKSQAILNLIEGLTEDSLQTIIDNLNQHYQEMNLSFCIRNVAGGYQIHLKPQFHNLIIKLREQSKSSKLSKSALETLTVIAYRQPVTRAQIEEIRGVDSSYSLKLLIQRKLVKISGRSQAAGRPLMYTTTDEFLRYFGLNHIKDLPKEEEIQIDLEENITDLGSFQASLDINLQSDD